MKLKSLWGKLVERKNEIDVAGAGSYEMCRHEAFNEAIDELGELSVLIDEEKILKRFDKVRWDAENEGKAPHIVIDRLRKEVKALANTNDIIKIRKTNE